MDLKDFSYDLPQELVAQYPLRRRDAARMLVIERTTQRIIHDKFSNLPKFIPPKSCLVLNNSKVIPARLYGRKKNTGGRFEIFILREINDSGMYRALMRPAKRLHTGDVLEFGHGLEVEVVDWENAIVQFNKKNILPYLNKIGHMPLPPYIKREDSRQDRTVYQTVYSKVNGSVAAPTAGLHFTKNLLRKLTSSGHTLFPVTLHVNYGTFKSVEAEDIRSHKMHSEEYHIAKRSLDGILRAKRQGRKIVAVGTTSCRSVESYAVSGRPQGETDLFIYPGFKFKMVDCLLTNFHQPKTTLLMLVSAFAGTELIREAYRQAIKNKYRFYSYGDCMLIL